MINQKWLLREQKSDNQIVRGLSDLERLFLHILHSKCDRLQIFKNNFFWSTISFEKFYGLCKHTNLSLDNQKKQIDLAIYLCRGQSSSQCS